MNINFKGGYFNFNFFNQIRLDFVQWIHGQCPVSPWTHWTLSTDIVQSAWTPLTFSRVPMDNVQTVLWVHGQCPLSPWTMSTESMDNVHWIHGHCPVWLVSLAFVHGLLGLCQEYPWTLSRLSNESMVNVHWVHGQCPGSPLSPWTFYRRDGCLNFMIKCLSEQYIVLVFMILSALLIWFLSTETLVNVVVLKSLSYFQVKQYYSWFCQ